MHSKIIDTKTLKTIIILVIIYVSANLILDEFFDLGFAGYIIISVCLVMVYMTIFNLNVRVNVVLVFSIIAFVSSALIVRNSRENIDSNSAIIGIWQTIDNSGDQITFEFINSSEVTVKIKAGQEEDLNYEYTLSENTLAFYNEDGSIRFQWAFDYIDDNKFKITENEDELTFYRQ